LSERQELHLNNIGNGAAVELFERELARILANIKDPNTHATSKRKINLEFVFTPYNDRSGAAIEVKITSKLIATTGVNATMYISRVSGGLAAFTNDGRQGHLQLDGPNDEEEEEAAIQ